MLQWLTLIFITLKLCKVITWSWGIVLLPLWIEIGIWLGYILFNVGVYVWKNAKR